MFIGTRKARKPKKRLVFGQVVLIALIAWCQFWLGAWIWVDNRYALIPDLSFSLNLSFFFDGREAAEVDEIMVAHRAATLPDVATNFSGLLTTGAERLKYLNAAAWLVPSSGSNRPGGWLCLEGNGDGDDSFETPPEPLVKPENQRESRRARAMTVWGDRRLVAAYKDFGHLKVAPASGPVIKLVDSPVSAAIGGLFLSSRDSPLLFLGDRRGAVEFFARNSA